MKTTARARDVMRRNPICVAQTASLQEVAELLGGNDISGAPVVDAMGRLIGVVSQRDIITRCVEGPLGSHPDSFFAALAQGHTGGNVSGAEDLGVVEDFMTVDPVTASPDDLVSDIARRMAEERVHRVVVVDRSQTPVGIVTTLDLLAIFPRP